MWFNTQGSPTIVGDLGEHLLISVDITCPRCIWNIIVVGPIYRNTATEYIVYNIHILTKRIVFSNTSLACTNAIAIFHATAIALNSSRATISLTLSTIDLCCCIISCWSVMIFETESFSI